MPDDLNCPECGKPAKSKAGLASHIRLKHGDVGQPLEPVVVGAPAQAPAPVTGPPAIIPEWRRATRLRIGKREITMLFPQCRQCQDADNAGYDWYLRCTHDPYVTLRELKTKKPKTSKEIGEDGQPTGRLIVTGVEEFISYSAIPNACEVSLSMGANSGKGVEWARRKGRIMPSELRSEVYPNGIADTCQFRDCKAQTGLKVYMMQTETGEAPVGVFCRKEEAQLVWYSETGTTIEVGEWSDRARQERTKMLAAAGVS